MVATYKFELLDDLINGERINKHTFELFRLELFEINKPFMFNIYMFGSYVGYLENKTRYNDINFLILGKKVLEIETLVKFLFLFHSLAKKYNLVYDIAYGTNLDINNIDFSGKMFNIIKGDVLLLYLYKNMILDNKPKFNMDLQRFENSSLFQYNINNGVVTNKVIKNTTMRTQFNIPIKII